MVLDMSCRKTKRVLGVASKFNFFNKKRKWLLIGSDVDSSKNLLMDENLSVESRILLATYDDGLNYHIYHCRSPALQRNGLMFISVVGNFSKTKGLIYASPFERINFSMHGTPLKVATSVGAAIF